MGHGTNIKPSVPYHRTNHIPTGNPTKHFYADRMRHLMDDSSSKPVEEMVNKINKARKTGKRKALPYTLVAFHFFLLLLLVCALNMFAVSPGEEFHLVLWKPW